MDVAKALGPENLNLRAVAALSHDAAVLRTLGLPPPDGNSGLAGPGPAAASAAGLGMAAEDASDEELDSEDLDYALDASCTNCTGHTLDGFCQVSASATQPQGHCALSAQHEPLPALSLVSWALALCCNLFHAVVSPWLLLGVSAIDVCQCQEESSVDLPVAQKWALCSMGLRLAWLTWQSLAQDCGHDAVNDEALFSSAARRGEPPARLPAGMTGLAFDERMTMHSEQSSTPHPERPDRIRAVIARLQASGLAGVLDFAPHRLQPITEHTAITACGSLCCCGISTASSASFTVLVMAAI